MGMDRWDPFREMVTLRDTMDRLLQQNLRPSQLLSGLRSDAIPLDVVERDDAYVVRAALPGVRPDDVEITVQGERLTIRAESKAEEERHGDNWLVREQRYGSLMRSISLPSPVSSEKAEAKVENGILSLRLPKIQEAMPRRISVSTGADTPPSTDRVTQESEESFPASDPPSWTPEKM